MNVEVQQYLFFAEVTRKLGLKELSKLFQETSNQETEHAFANFRLLHPELVIDDPSELTDEQTKEIAARCLELAIAWRGDKNYQSKAGQAFELVDL